MATKSERLELRLSEATLDRIDEWRSREEDVPSRSEAARRLLEHGLARHRAEEIHLSQNERLVTWLLAEVLENQLSSQKSRAAASKLDEVKFLKEVIYGGHFWALGWEFSGIFHNHRDTPLAVRRVVDILDMWSFIESAYADFDDDAKLRIETEAGPLGRDPKFHGFDGNNESEYLGIAQFLVEKMGRFESFQGRSFNSHSPTVSRYTRMAAAFEEMRKNLIGRNLTPEQVITLLKQ